MRRRLAACLLLVPLIVPAHLGVAAAQRPERVRIEAAQGATLLVHGTYPPVRSSCVAPVQPLLHARFRGAIEVGRDADGSLFVIGELPFEDYLKGIAEVPRTWPRAALEAQVVAARSYALARMRFGDPTGERLGYDLCATDACQVYRGTGIELGPWGERWVRAVEATAGEALVFRGRPAETLYFSTSNGRTLGNERVFGGDPLPYLRPVVERDDGASPVSRWVAELPLTDIARFLGRAGEWPGGRIREVRRRGARLVLIGPGRRTSLTRAELRSALNAWAPCLEPGTYPGEGLPQTVPSIWFRATTEASRLVLRGRGWGHGVGMVQWGAYGKAQRGLTAGDVLAFYYGGLRPRPVETPATIRVGIATGLRTVTIVPDGPVRVADGMPGDGPWRISAPGRRLRVRPAPEPPAQLTVTGFDAPRRGRAGRPVRTALRTDRAVEARLLLLGPDDEEVPLGPARPSLEGRVRIVGSVPADIVDGTYRLVAEVTDGIDTVRTRGTPIRVTGGTGGASPTTAPDPTSSPRAAEPEPDGERDGPGAVATVAVAVALALALALVSWLGVRRAGRRPAGLR